MATLRSPNGVRVVVADRVATTLGWPAWQAEPEAPKKTRKKRTTDEQEDATPSETE